MSSSPTFNDEVCANFIKVIMLNSDYVFGTVWAGLKAEEIDDKKEDDVVDDLVEDEEEDEEEEEDDDDEEEEISTW